MQIMSSYNVTREAAGICERAIQNDLFSPHGEDSDGRHLLEIRSAERAYIAVVQVTDGPFGRDLLITAAYEVAPAGVPALVKNLKEI